MEITISSILFEACEPSGSLLLFSAVRGIGETIARVLKTVIFSWFDTLRDLRSVALLAVQRLTFLKST